MWREESNSGRLEGASDRRARRGEVSEHSVHIETSNMIEAGDTWSTRCINLLQQSAMLVAA